MTAVALYAASAAKLMPSLFERPGFGFEASKLILSRLFLNMRVPHEGQGARIRQVSFRITDLCNLRCHTCGQWGDNGYLRGQSMPDLMRNEVEPERYVELLEDVVAHGHRPGLYIWGGEPMLYRGTVPLIEAAARLNLPVSISTNGTKVADNAERIAAAPMFLAQLSIDGHDAATHNASRPGANPSTDNFSTVISALDALKEERERRRSRLPILAGLITINHLNADRLVDLYDAFADRLDAMVFSLLWWIDEESANQHTLDYTRRFGQMPTLHHGWVGGWKPTDYEGLSRQLREICRRATRTKGPAAAILPHLTSARDLERYYTDHAATFGYDRCTSIYRAVEIDSNGNMSPCRDYHDYVVGNVKTNTITELWNSEAYRRFRRSLTEEGLMPVCTRCCGLMGN